MKIALVTGPSSGIGRATAREMGSMGFHVIAAGRSRERTMAVVDEIKSGGGSSEYLPLDLTSLESARKAARTFAESGRELDVLINNAGVGGVRGMTVDGFELHFGVNHLGHFMLTHHLGPAFRQGTRIVTVSSEVHRRVDGIDFDAVRSKTGFFERLHAYGVSKLANILFARRLAQLQPAWNTYSVHPGLADTAIFPAIARPFFRDRKTPQEAARTIVWCATSEDVAAQTGLYYSRRKVWEPSETAQDDQLADRLWDHSQRWCGIASTY